MLTCRRYPYNTSNVGIDDERSTVKVAFSNDSLPSGFLWLIQTILSTAQIA